METIKLPTKKSKIVSDLSKYSILLYGKIKIGKTSLAAQFPDALFLMTEPGGKSLEIYQMNVRNWTHFKQILDALESSDMYKTIVIDTTDNLYKMCTDWYCKKKAIQHPSDEEWGKAWQMINDEFMLGMIKLMQLNRGVIFTSHAQQHEIKKYAQASVTEVVPTLAKQGRRVLEPIVDMVCYFRYAEKETDDSTRILQIRGDSNVVAGCRLTQNFVGIKEIPMGRSATEGYRNFIKAFNNDTDFTSQSIKKAPTRLVIRK